MKNDRSSLSKMVQRQETGKTATPIFRSVEPGMFLKHTDFDFHLKRLGMLAGFPDGVRSYDLREAASAIDGPEVIIAQRVQIMGHARAGVFKLCIHRSVQAGKQVTFLGNPSRKELITGILQVDASRDANVARKLENGIPRESREPHLSSTIKTTDSSLEMTSSFPSTERPTFRLAERMRCHGTLRAIFGEALLRSVAWHCVLFCCAESMIDRVNR